VPVISAGIIASPFFTRSGPEGRTLTDFLPFVKHGHSVAVANIAMLSEVERVTCQRTLELLDAPICLRAGEGATLSNLR
jgi:hypothetical protein